MKNNFEQDKDIQQIINNNESLLTSAALLEIKDSESQKNAISLLSDLKNIKKAIEEKRKFYTVPVNDILKYINSTAKKFVEPFLKAESTLKNGLNDYEKMLREEKRKQDEINHKKMEESMSKGNPAPITPTVQVEKTVESDTGNKLTYRDNWIAEIEDEKELIKYAVNNDLWNLISVNNSELNKLAKMYKDSKKINGCQFINNKIPVVR